MSALASEICVQRAPDPVKRLENIEDLLYWQLDIARRKRLDMERLEARQADDGPDYYLALRERNDAVDAAKGYIDVLRRAEFPLSPVVEQLARFEGIDR